MEQFIYGRNTVRDSLLLKRVQSIYFSKGFNDQRMIDEAKKQKIDMHFVDEGTLRKMVKGNAQGVVAVVERFEYSSLEEIISLSKKVTNPIVILLDEINDPGNFGAILRSADAFSACGVIIKKHGQVMLNETVAKTSTGAINHVKVAQVSNLSNALETLSKNGFWSVSADGSGRVDYDKITYDFPVALVIGSEGNGIAPLVLKRSDYVVKIPMTGHVNSLNASVAAGIFLAHIRASQNK